MCVKNHLFFAFSAATTKNNPQHANSNQMCTSHTFFFAKTISVLHFNGSKSNQKYKIKTTTTTTKTEKGREKETFCAGEIRKKVEHIHAYSGFCFAFLWVVFLWALFCLNDIYIIILHHNKNKMAHYREIHEAKMLQKRKTNNTLFSLHWSLRLSSLVCWSRCWLFERTPPPLLSA